MDYHTGQPAPHLAPIPGVHGLRVLRGAGVHGSAHLRGRRRARIHRLRAGRRRRGNAPVRLRRVAAVGDRAMLRRRRLVIGSRPRLRLLRRRQRLRCIVLRVLHWRGGVLRRVVLLLRRMLHDRLLLLRRMLHDRLRLLLLLRLGRW